MILRSCVRRGLPPLAGALWLAGCGHSAPTRVFTLAAVPSQTAPLAYAGPPFRVDAVHFPPAFDRVEVVRQTGAEQLQIDDLDHWGASPGDLARTAITQDLAARLPAGAVIYPDSPKPPSAAGLVVDVLAFQRTDQGYVLDASWSRSGPSPDAPRVGGQVRLTDPDAGPGDAAGEAAALGRLLGQLADAVAAGAGAAPR
jgi:uncharacterized protein